jgi:hypothetical protein
MLCQNVIRLLMQQHRSFNLHDVSRSPGCLIHSLQRSGSTSGRHSVASTDAGGCVSCDITEADNNHF